MFFELTIRKQSVTRKRKIQGLPDVKGNESKPLQLMHLSWLHKYKDSSKSLTLSIERS